jgi:hypothetical protein
MKKTKTKIAFLSVSLIAIIIGCNTREISKINDLEIKNIDPFRWNCKTLEGKLTFVDYPNLCCDLKKISFPKEWEIKNEISSTNEFIVGIDTLSMMNENDTLWGSMQVMKHKFNDEFRLVDFFTSTIKIISDSAAVNKSFEILELGNTKKDEKEVYWLYFFRNDPHFKRALSLSFYLQGESNKSIIQIDFMRYGQPRKIEDLCEFENGWNSIKFY